MQDDNAMNDRLAELRKLTSDLAKAEKDREFWHDEANRMAALLGQEQVKKSNPGAKLYGAAAARKTVSQDLMVFASEAFEAGRAISPDEIRDIALQLRKESAA